MTHYICTGGCGEYSEIPGTCNNQSCIKYHQPLTVCHCGDGHHEQAYEHPNTTIEAEDAEVI